MLESSCQLVLKIISAGINGSSCYYLSRIKGYINGIFYFTVGTSFKEVYFSHYCNKYMQWYILPDYFYENNLL